MHRLVRIDAQCLTQEELDYEISIRPDTGSDEEEAAGAATPGHSVNTPLGRVIQKMNIEWQTGQRPEQMGQVSADDTERIASELDACNNGLNELYDAIEDIQMQVEEPIDPITGVDPVTNTIPLASRCIHYRNRLSRLPKDPLNNDQKTVLIKLSRKMKTIINLLDRFVTHGTDGLPMLLRDVTILSMNQGPTAEPFAQGTMNSTINERPIQANGVQATDSLDIGQDLGHVQANTAPLRQPATTGFNFDPHGNTWSNRQDHAPTPLPRQNNAMTANTYANISTGVNGATSDARQVNFSLESEDFGQNNPLFRTAPVPTVTQPQSQLYTPFRATHNAQQHAQWNERMDAQQDREPRPNFQSTMGPIQTAPQTNNVPQANQYGTYTDQEHRLRPTNIRPTVPDVARWNEFNSQPHVHQLPTAQPTYEHNRAGNNEPQTFAQQQNRRQSVHFAPPNPYNTIPLITQPQNNAINNSATSAYHPATTPHPNYYNDDPLNLRQEGLNMPTQNQQPLRGVLQRAQPMNIYQAQQFLGRTLGYRKYEGYTTDHAKYIQLDEFISQIRQFHKNTGSSEQEVLSHMSTFMTGNAFGWWKTNSPSIHTISELESRLRMRFERQSNDPLSNVVEFACRRQGEKEDLLDYVDEMRQRLDRCGPALSEERAIETIVNNANATYNRMLAARAYPSLEILNRHAEYLMKGSKPKKINAQIPSNPRYDKRQNSQPNRNGFNAVEIHEIHEEEGIVSESDTDSSSEDGEKEKETVDTSAMIELAAVISDWQKKRQANRPKSSQHKESKPNKTNTATTAAPTQKQTVTLEVCRNCSGWGHNSKVCSKPRKIFCHGCGKPDVYRNTCENCNNELSKNEKTTQ